MIQAFVAKKLINVALKKIMKAREIKNLRKYVEEDNELDLQVRAHAKAIDKYGKYIEELEKEVAILKKNSHPIRDFVTCDCCKKKLKQKKEK
jgi:hypothetical protein